MNCAFSLSLLAAVCLPHFICPASAEAPEINSTNALSTTAPEVSGLSTTQPFNVQHSATPHTWTTPTNAMESTSSSKSTEETIGASVMANVTGGTKEETNATSTIPQTTASVTTAPQSTLTETATLHSTPSLTAMPQSTSSDSQKSVFQPFTNSSPLQPVSFSSESATLNPSKANTTQQQNNPTSGRNTVFFKYSPKIADVRPLVFEHPTVIRTTCLVSNDASEDEPDQNNTSEIPTLSPEV